MNIFVRLGVAALATVGLAIAPMGNHTAVSQERQGCFIVDPFGNLVKLDDICPAPAPFEGPALGTGDIQITLRWVTEDDLDLAVTGPDGGTIFWGNPGSGNSTGGQLDRDDNSGCAAVTESPIENVFWPVGAAPDGEYSVEVALFQRCTAGTTPINFELQILTLGTTEIIQGSVNDIEPLFTHIFSLPTEGDTGQP